MPRGYDAVVTTIDMSRTIGNRIVSTETIGRYRRRWVAVLAGWFASGGGRHPIYKRFEIRRA